MVLTELIAFVATHKIAFVKFILEGYDGLAVMSTLDQYEGKVVFRYHPACHDEIVELLTWLGVKINSLEST